MRFGYVGDAESSGVGDDDINVNGSNTTLTDNFLAAFDPSGISAILVMASTLKPDVGNSYFQAVDGGDLNIDSYSVSDIGSLKILLGVSIFTDVANLFEEGEDFVKTNSDSFSGGGAESGSLSLRLDAQGEEGYYRVVAGTDLPAGRYMALFRMKTNTGSQTLRCRVYNDTDSDFRNEEQAWVDITPTSTWAMEQLVFDITDQDVTDTDNIDLELDYDNATNNTVYCDYVLIVPMSDGEGWPQDLAKCLLRYFDQWFNVFTR
jgi:hypothetical protein